MPDELLTTAILGFSQSASDRPMPCHCALRTAQRYEPRGKLLRRRRVMRALGIVGRSGGKAAINIDMSIKRMSTGMTAMVRSAKTAAAPRRTPAVAPGPKAGARRSGHGGTPQRSDGGGPPPRAEKRPAPVAGTDAEVNRYIAAYIMGVANRLANGA